VTLVAFDPIEIDGLDLAVSDRGAQGRASETAGQLPARARRKSRVFDAPGPDVFQHACKLGC
jgi:hypothetical protein